MSDPYTTILRDIASDPNQYALMVIASWCDKSADRIEELEKDLMCCGDARGIEGMEYEHRIAELEAEVERLREHLGHVLTCRDDYGCPLCDDAFAAVEESDDE